MRVQNSLLALAAAASLSFAGTAQAQIAAHGEVRYADAKKIVDACVAEATKLGKPVTVAVLNQRGDLLSLASLDGADIFSSTIAQKKASTALRFGKPSKAMDGIPADVKAALDLFTHAGGLPILVGGHVVGAVGASGMGPGEEDCAAHAIEAALK